MDGLGGVEVLAKDGARAGEAGKLLDFGAVSIIFAGDAGTH